MDGDEEDEGRDDEFEGGFEVLKGMQKTDSLSRSRITRVSKECKERDVTSKIDI